MFTRGTFLPLRHHHHHHHPRRQSLAAIASSLSRRTETRFPLLFSLRRVRYNSRVGTRNARARCGDGAVSLAAASDSPLCAMSRVANVSRWNARARPAIYPCSAAAAVGPRGQAHLGTGGGGVVLVATSGLAPPGGDVWLCSSRTSIFQECSSSSSSSFMESTRRARLRRAWSPWIARRTSPKMSSSRCEGAIRGQSGGDRGAIRGQ
eukprot:193049-Prorocentrum_minimum.AAC.4